jgi:hypothetical protein
LAAAEKVAKYRPAQLAAIRLAGDINAQVITEGSLDELPTMYSPSPPQMLKPRMLGRCHIPRPSCSNWSTRL